MTEDDFLKKGIVEINYVDVHIKDFNDFNCELLKLINKYNINALISRKNERIYRIYGNIK